MSERNKHHYAALQSGLVNHPTMILIAVCLAQFMAPLMLTAVGVALPTLGHDLNASAMQLGLIEQLYVVSLAMGMLAFGRYGDIVGQRRVFLPGLVVFTLMTCSLGLVTSIPMMLIQRFAQGIGACMMISGSLALVAKAYPPHVRGRKIGLVSAWTYAGLSLGPVLGGYLTEQYGWRQVFLMPVPLGIAAICTVLLFMRDEGNAIKGEPMDWRGGLVYAISVALLMIGASHAKTLPWGPLAIVAGLSGLLFFWQLQQRTKVPLIDVALLRHNRFFTMSGLAALGNYAATFGVTFMMSLYLQFVRGLSPREAGGMLLVQPILQFVVSPLAGQLADCYETTGVATCGMLLSFIGLSATALTLAPDTSLVLIGTELACIGAGFGIFITPNSTAIMASVRPQQFGLASGTIASMRTLGMAVSMTSITVIFSLCMGQAQVSAATAGEFLPSMRWALMALALFSCLGAFLSLGRGKKQPRTA